MISRNKKRPQGYCSVLRFEWLESRLTLSAHPLAVLATHAVTGRGALAGVAAEVAPAQIHTQASLAARAAVAQASRPTTVAQENLTSNNTIAVPAANLDPNLVNAWGIAPTTAGQFWVAENGSGKIELFTSRGAVLRTVTIPPTLGTLATPTGIVANPNGLGGFLLRNGRPATVLVATEDGTIAGWNPGLGSTAQIVVNNSAATAAGPGAVYKGLAVSQAGGNTFLYATNFRTGTIDIFNTRFQRLTALLGGNFTDPNAIAGFAPFGIQNINGRLYVTYARQDASRHDPVPGVGSGYIDVFTTNGSFAGRLATGGALNAPWGITLAPPQYGRFSNMLLVGNFGDGTINAFNPATRASLGPLTNNTGTSIRIDGLWGLGFARGGPDGPGLRLVFASGPVGEGFGLIGRLLKTSPA